MYKFRYFYYVTNELGYSILTSVTIIITLCLAIFLPKWREICQRVNKTKRKKWMKDAILCLIEAYKEESCLYAVIHQLS